MERRRFWLILLLFLALVAIVGLWRFRPAEVKAETKRPHQRSTQDPTLAAPRLPPSPLEAPPHTIAKAGRPQEDRHLREVAQRLGRAVVLKDHKTIEAIAQSLPSIYESDVQDFARWLQEDLFLAAGTATLARWFRLYALVPELVASISGPGHVLLKDQIIETLGILGGDAAGTALLSVLRSGEDGSLRARAARAAARLSGPEVYQTLVESLRKEPAIEVREACIEALRSMPSQELVGILLEALSRERDPNVFARLAATAYEAGETTTRQTVFQVLENNPAAADRIDQWSRLEGPPRYTRPYDDLFFLSGGTVVPYDTVKYRKVGITVEPGSALSEVTAVLFRTAPFDRYRIFFYLRRADEFSEDLMNGTTPHAYDAEGRPMERLPVNDLDGTIFIRFVDPITLPPGVLGYTEGSKSMVTRVSLLHEVGHSFARLADEYSNPLAGQPTEVNLEERNRSTAKWQALIEQDLLPREKILRVEAGHDLTDKGHYRIPSSNCHMNNHSTDDRFCPVCQLQIIATISELTRVPLPW